MAATGNPAWTHRVRRALGLFAAGLLLAGCTSGAVKQGSADGDDGYVSPDGTVRLVTVTDRVPAPPLRGRSLEGGTVDLRDFPGKIVVVNYWASWCPPCIKEQPRLNALYAENHAKGVELLGVDIRDTDTNARAFRANHEVRYPTLVDESGSTLLGFRGPIAIPGTPPSSVVIDRDGRVAARIIGETPDGILQPIVDQLLAEGPGA